MNRKFSWLGTSIVTTIEAIILGIIQGLTEFLPVSSSGHLALAQHLFGLEGLDRFIVFDLVCHMGTLGAIFIIFYPKILSLVNGSHREFAQILIGTLPLFFIVPLLKSIESLYDQVQWLGYFFLTTALLLWLGVHFGKENPAGKRNNRWATDPLIIGAFQALALLPGVSRSGSTISSARMLGWKTEDAIAFSFLLAIPAIMGGTLLKAAQLYLKGSTGSHLIGWQPYFAGLLTSFIFGVLALKILIKLAANQKMMYFVWYCLLLGIGCIFYFS